MSGARKGHQPSHVTTSLWASSNRPSRLLMTAKPAEDNHTFLSPLKISNQAYARQSKPFVLHTEQLKYNVSKQYEFELRTGKSPLPPTSHPLPFPSQLGEEWLATNDMTLRWLIAIKLQKESKIFVVTRKELRIS